MDGIDPTEAEKGDTVATSQSLSTINSPHLDPDAFTRTNTDQRAEASSILTSNILFLTGSLLFLWIALWDWMENGEENTDDNSAIREDDELPLNILAWNSWQILTAAAPFCFLVDAVVDMRYAFQLIRRDHTPSRFGDDPRWEIGISLLFGMAASCDFLAAVVVRDEDTLTNYVPSSLAVHLYMLMSIFALWGRNVQVQTYATRWYQAADIIFLLGSLIDVVLSYFETPGISSDLKTILQRWSVVSASLWLVNSILYILADTCLYKIQRREWNASRLLQPAEEQLNSLVTEPCVDLLWVQVTANIAPVSLESSSHFEEARSRIDLTDDFHFEDAVEDFDDEDI
jgi:hypothetical protein